MTILKLEQALLMAIDTELAAARRYESMAMRAAAPDTERFLRHMAEQEKRHAGLIQEAAKEWSSQAERMIGRTVDDEAGPPAWEFPEDLELLEAVDLALTAEEQAAGYYRSLSRSPNSEVAEFFQDMEKRERAHVDELQRFKAKLQQGARLK